MIGRVLRQRGAFLILLSASSLLSFSLSLSIEEIYNKEHLHDIYHRSDGSGIPRTNAAIALYEPSCGHSLSQLGFSSISSELQFLTLTHDWKTSRAVSWYKWTEDFDLTRDFDVTVCPSIYYLPKNASLKPVKWDNQGRYTDWIWSQLKRRISIVNEWDSPVKLLRADFGSESVESFGLIATFQPGKTPTELDSYATQIIIAVDESSTQYLGHLAVDEGETQLRVSKDVKSQPLSVWWAEERAKFKKALDVWENNMWSHAMRHLMNYKQPPLLPGYTKTGYLKKKIPAEAYSLLKNYYDTHKSKSLLEDWHPYGTQINYDAVTTRMVELPHETKLKVGEIIRPELEAWSNQELVFAALYGIREYFNGGVLKSHVDRVETHVISAILNVDQDVEEDWLLEVINYEGDKVFIPMEPGDMVFYESSKLIHGRPKPLKGKFYANAFLHFRPTLWSQYSLSPINIFRTPDQQIPLRPFNVIGKRLDDIADHGSAWLKSIEAGQKEEL